MKYVEKNHRQSSYTKFQYISHFPQNSNTRKTPADVYISFACYTTLQAAVQVTPQIVLDKLNFIYPPIFEVI